MEQQEFPTKLVFPRDARRRCIIKWHPTRGLQHRPSTTDRVKYRQYTKRNDPDRGRQNHRPTRRCRSDILMSVILFNIYLCYLSVVVISAWSSLSSLEFWEWDRMGSCEITYLSIIFRIMLGGVRGLG